MSQLILLWQVPIPSSFFILFSSSSCYFHLSSSSFSSSTLFHDNTNISHPLQFSSASSCLILLILPYFLRCSDSLSHLFIISIVCFTHIFHLPSSWFSVFPHIAYKTCLIFVTCSVCILLALIIFPSVFFYRIFYFSPYFFISFFHLFIFCLSSLSPFFFIYILLSVLFHLPSYHFSFVPHLSL